MLDLTRRDFLKLGGAALASLALAGRGRSALAAGVAPVLYRGTDTYPRVAVTVDDCQLLSRLHMLQVALMDNPSARITLFPTGLALLNNETKEAGIWKWFYTRGHEFGWHGWDHVDPWRLSDSQVLQDYDLWENALYRVLGAQPLVKFARPPGGGLSPSLLNMCALRGKVPTMWSTGFAGAVDVGVAAAKRARYGDIALMHTRDQPARPEINQEESWDMTIMSLILPDFAARAIECVTLSTLYDDLLREQNSSDGCGIGPGQSMTRVCLD